jgi:hypothetical protein
MALDTASLEAETSGVIASSRRPLLSLTCALSVVALSQTGGCKAVRNLDNQPAGAGPNAMLDDTAVGKSRCDEGKVTQRPFVVEWDATDLSTFEAKASRDLVFVKYEGCQLEMIYGCSDNSIPGRYGRYQEPVFTSGTVESFQMRDQDELWAKLPLGAAQFGGNVEIGQALELIYFVSGVVTASQNTVHESVFGGGNPACAEATHFVSAFNLGAFELHAYEGAKGQVDVGFKNAGGGAKTSSESANLKQGGSLESCESQTQRQCRVPIRIVLQQIGRGEPAGHGDEGMVAPPAPVQPTPYQDTPEAKVRALRDSAGKRQQDGDALGCLADLERADKMDPSGGKTSGVLYTRAMCTMGSGKCEEGKKMLREYLASIDTKRKTNDKKLDAQVKATASYACPVDMQGSLEDKVTRIAVEIGTAQEKGDAPSCVRMGQTAEKLIKKNQKRLATDVSMRNNLAGLLMRTSSCLDGLEECKQARDWYFRYYDAAFSSTMSAADVKAAAEQTWAYMPNCGKK